MSSKKKLLLAFGLPAAFVAFLLLADFALQTPLTLLLLIPVYLQHLLVANWLGVEAGGCTGGGFFCLPLHFPLFIATAVCDYLLVALAIAGGLTLIEKFKNRKSFDGR